MDCYLFLIKLSFLRESTAKLSGFSVSSLFAGGVVCVCNNFTLRTAARRNVVE